MSNDSSLIAQIGRTVGLWGDLKFHLHTDFPEQFKIGTSYQSDRGTLTISDINIEKAFKEVSFGEYVACMGASIEPLSFYSDKIEERGTKAKKISYQKVSYLALTVCIVLGVVLIMTSLIPFIFEKKKKENFMQP